MTLLALRRADRRTAASSGQPRAALTRASLQLAAILLGALASLLAASTSLDRIDFARLAAEPARHLARGGGARMAGTRLRGAAPHLPSSSERRDGSRRDAGNRGFLCSGAITVIGLAAYERALWALVSNTSLDVLHFSLHPLSAGRLSVAFRAGAAPRRGDDGSRSRSSAPPQRRRAPRAILARALPGTIARRDRRRRRGRPVVGLDSLDTAWRSPSPLRPPPAPSSLGRLGARLHRLSQSARLGVSFVALVAPARGHVSRPCTPTRPRPRNASSSTSYAPEAASQRDDLQRRLQRTVEQIDQVPSLAEVRTRAHIRHADNRSRVRRLVEHRPRALPPDVGHRPVRCRGPGRQFVRASLARVRDRSIQGVRMRQLGAAVRRDLAVRFEASAMSSGPAAASARTAVWSAASSCA